MKKLDDGTEVVDRMYYYLLDWNDGNSFVYINDKFSKNALHRLTKREFMDLFDYAISYDKTIVNDSL